MGMMTMGEQEWFYQDKYLKTNIVNRYSRIFHHIDTKDVKKKHLENIEVRRIKEQEKKEVEMILIEHHQELNRQKSNWRTDLTNA